MYDPLIALVIGIVVVTIPVLLFYPDRGLVARFARSQRNSVRVLREDALKHICTSELDGSLPTLQSIAGALEIPPNDAAALIADLEQSELITSKGEGLCLTASGRQAALHIIRAHRLWEQHLAQETGYDEQEWHMQAEQREHEMSSDDAQLLAARLGHPTEDPHGDPIPTAAGTHATPLGHRLTAMPLNVPLRVVHVEDEPEIIYAQLLADDVYPGMELRLLEMSPQRVRFWANGSEHILAPIVAGSVAVVSLQAHAADAIKTGERLSILKPGESAWVTAISPRCHGQERWRLMDLGILPGTLIEAELVSAGGDPTAYRVRDTLLALRREQANFIYIRRANEARS